MIFLFVVELAMGQSDATISRSLGVLRRGSLAYIFFVGVILIGIIVPAALVIASYPASIGIAGLLIAGVASLIGDLAYKYCMNTAGTYVPLVSGRGR